MEPITDATSYASRRERALQAFGHLLRNWRLRQGWTQHTPSQWAKEAGFNAPAAGNYSNLERALAGNPSPSTIFMLADLNQRLARRDWGTVRTRALRERIERAEPIVDEQGIPWGPRESWAASVGIQPIPPELLEPEATPMPTADPVQLCDGWRAQLSQVVIQHDLDLLEAVAAVTKLVPPEHRKRLRQVLGLAGCSYEQQELSALWGPDGWLPQQALTKWEAMVGERSQGA